MEITKKENQKLLLAKQIFKVQELTKEQAEFTLGRKLTDSMVARKCQRKNKLQHNNFFHDTTVFPQQLFSQQLTIYTTT